MGATESVPNPDARTLQMMEQVGMEAHELRHFWRHFRRGDRKLRGVIDADTFFRIFNEKRTLFGDALFELIDVSGDIDFGKYVKAVCTYCLFEPEEILKFCFFVFDRDKLGYVDKDDLALMLKILHGKIDGNVRIALDALGQVDFHEFHQVYRQFPALLYPAFRLQQKFAANTMGHAWWDARKRALYEERMRLVAVETLPERNERVRLVKLREVQVRKKMGCLRYLCCPGYRALYRSLFPIDDKEELRKHDELERERQEKLRKEEERKKKLAAERNPETPAWRQYLKKKHLLVGDDDKPQRRRRTPLSDRAAKAQTRHAVKVAAAYAD